MTRVGVRLCTPGRRFITAVQNGQWLVYRIIFNTHKSRLAGAVLRVGGIGPLFKNLPLWPPNAVSNSCIVHLCVCHY